MGSTFEFAVEKPKSTHKNCFSQVVSRCLTTAIFIKGELCLRALDRVSMNPHAGHSERSGGETLPMTSEIIRGCCFFKTSSMPSGASRSAPCRKSKPPLEFVEPWIVADPIVRGH